MARQVNLFTSGWKATGANVQVPQHSLTLRFQWIDNAGVSHEGTRTVLFPNVLALLPADYVADKIKEMLIDYARSDLGVNE